MPTTYYETAGTGQTAELLKLAQDAATSTFVMTVARGTPQVATFKATGINPGAGVSNTGTFTVNLELTTASDVTGNCSLAIQVIRYNSAGTAQATVTLGASQSITSTGIKTFTGVNLALGTWAATDFLGMTATITNNNTSGTAKTFTVRIGGASNTVVVPWTQTVPTALVVANAAQAQTAGAVTITQTTTTQESLFTTQTPATPTNTEATYTLGTVFRPAVSGKIVGVRVWCSSAQTGTIGGLYSWTSDTAGTLLASRTFGTLTAGGWTSVYFTTPVDVTAGTKYVTAWGNTANYGVTSNFFTSADLVNGNLTAPKVAAGTNNGKFIATGPAIAYPDGNFGDSNYFVDTIFVADAVSGTNLTVQNAAQAQTAASPTIVRNISLTVQNAAQAQTAGNVTVVGSTNLVVVNATQSQASGAPGGGTSQPTFVKQATGTSAAGATAINATFGSAPTAGDLLVLVLGGDKNSGALTAAGWTEVYALLSTSVSLYFYWKVSDGTETTVSVSHATASAAGNNLWVGEYTDTGIAGSTWQVSATASNPQPPTEVTAVTWPTGTTAAAIAAGLAIACAAIDSTQSITTLDAWGNAYATRITQATWTSSGKGGAYVGEKQVASGVTASSTFNYTGTADQVAAAIAVFSKVGSDVVITPVVSGSNLVVANATQAETATSPTLVRNINLLAANATQAESATAPSLVQNVNLTVQNATQAETVSSPTLTISTPLLVQGATQAETATSPTLTQLHVLTVQAANQAEAATSPALTQVHILTVQNATQAETVTSSALIQVYGLLPQSVAQGQTVGSPVLTQVHNLAVQGANQGQSAGSIALTRIFNLVTQNANQAESAGSPALTQLNVLAVQGARQNQVVGNAVLIVGGITLTIANARQSQTAGAVVLTQVHILAVQSANQAESAGSPVLTQLHVLAIQNAKQLQSAQSPALTQVHLLSVQNAQQPESAGNVAITQVHILTTQSVSQAQTATSFGLTQVHVFAVQDAGQAQGAQAPVLTQLHILVVQGSIQAQAAANVVLTNGTPLEVLNAYQDQVAQLVTITILVAPTTKERRLKIQTLLEELLGSSNVYYQPPPNVKMQYPCIVYTRSYEKSQFAANIPYIVAKRYTVTVIDRDPDSSIPDKVAALPMSRFQRFFTADNLNHDVFDLYFT